MKSTTIKIDAVMREELKEATFTVSMETKEIYSMTDVLRYLVNNHLDEAIKGMIKNHKVRQ